jgi:hypothetical protein
MIYSDFTYSSNFSNLTNQEITDAIGVVETMFYGALQCWAILPDPQRTKARLLFENLCVAWYLSDLNPSRVRGIVANGGLPLSSKSIGGTSVAFEHIDTQSGLEQLKTNTFGIKAYSFFQSAPERFTIYG